MKYGQAMKFFICQERWFPRELYAKYEIEKYYCQTRATSLNVNHLCIFQQTLKLTKEGLRVTKSARARILPSGRGPID
jgi:hypothetical protein